MLTIVLAARLEVKGKPLVQGDIVFRSVAYRATIAALLSLLVLAVGAPSAAAKPDPGGSGSVVTTTLHPYCPLERVDTHLVRCDDLTGAGVPAPLFIPEQFTFTAPVAR
jgi:hypothetical protein